MRISPMGVGARPVRGVRTVAVLLGAAAVLAAAGCGGGSGSGGDKGQTTIRFSWWGNEERAKITRTAVRAFEAANPTIKVKTESVDFNSYFDRLATAVAAKDEPDMITMGGAYPREYGARGVLLDLAKVSGQLDLSLYDKSALSNGYFDGAQYGVPTGVNSFGLVANPAVFAKAGVALPDDNTWSWEDFARIAAEISKKAPKGTYGSEDPTSPELLDLYTHQHTGQGLYGKDGKLAITAESTAQWLTYDLGLMKAGATPSASMTAELSGQPNPEQTLLGQGKAAMKFAWSNQLSAFQKASGANLVMLRVPGETTQMKPGQWLQASQLYTISARSKHKDAAAKLISFLTTSTVAADAIGVDRGIPAVDGVRKHLSPTLTTTRKTEFAYISRIGGLTDGTFVVGPKGSTASTAALTRLNQAVLFGRTSPAEAGKQFVTEMTAAIS